MPKKRHLLAVSIATLALLLSGCCAGAENASPGSAPSGSLETVAPPAAAGQSKAEACALVQSSCDQFSTVSSKVDTSNPQAAIETFTKLSGNTTDALASIANSEVKPAATKAATARVDYVAFLEAVVSSPFEGPGHAAEGDRRAGRVHRGGALCAG